MGRSLNKTTSMEIYKKIAAVMSEMGPIAKDKRNTQQNYNFRGIDQLMDALSPIAAKHGIFPTTLKVEDIANEHVTSKNGGAGYRTVRRFTFRIYAEDGSYIDTTTDGEAIDYGDKSSNKAYSVAYREAMFKLFIVPFENEDIEEQSHDLKPEPKPAAKPAKKDSPHLAQKLRIMTLMKELGQEIDKATAQDKVRALTGLELIEEAYPDIISRLEALVEERNQK